MRRQNQDTSPLFGSTHARRIASPFQRRRAARVLWASLCLIPLTFGVSIDKAYSAEVRYVADRFKASMRVRPGSRAVLKYLVAGDKVELVEGKQRTDYLKVRTDDGQVGYIAARDLQSDLPAQAKVAELEAKLKKAHEVPPSLVDADQEQLAAAARGLLADKKKLEQEVATMRRASATVLETANERDQLRIQVSNLNREKAELFQENRDLRAQSNQHWFMVGGLVLAGGVLLGMILPRFSSRKPRSSWSSL